MRDFEMLGLTWDEGPYFQHDRDVAYQQAFQKLEEAGLVYPCFCTRGELHAASAPHRSDGQVLYAGTCRNLTPEQVAEKQNYRAPALRLRVPDEEWSFTDGHMGPYRENLARDCGDFLLRRSDGMFAYQLAVVVDDAAMGVTEVVRGADLLDSTPRQMYLYQLLGLRTPNFYHVPLLLTADGRRLSKRDADAGLDDLQTRSGAEEIIGKLAYLAGCNPSAQPRTPESLLADFAWEKVPKEDICIPEGLF
jgi:glutamyl-tRNA synthetase